MEGGWGDIIQYHVRPGAADNIDAVFGKELKAGRVITGHNVIPGGTLCQEALLPGHRNCRNALGWSMEHFAGEAGNGLTELVIDLVSNAHHPD